MTNHILLVEDDEFKRSKITSLIISLFPDAQLDFAMSVHSAVSRIQSRAYDMVILDMSLPSHDLRKGGGPTPSILSGGNEIIMEIAFLERSDKIIIVTQYPEVEIENELVPLSNVSEAIHKTVGTDILGVVHYDHDTEEWKSELIRLMGVA